ncbi:hypothetical protein GCM10027275_36510 [Rhabdobacter roseus]|uniref:Methane oxygenase PmoA n=1 Tax=Rhabdobacter roseus TaxID=1655419 RepID=A0A840TWI1_9BACT|nr:PmoA family protein [Rhabdobacter roseus]MBB5285942.1 hypothetical protein [Rhabdobacter roseus]
MKNIATIALALYAGVATAQRVELTHLEAEKKVTVTVDGKPFTAYIYPGGDLKKAVLYPVQTAHGTAITRGWPMDPRPDERVDHPHHVGVWLNHGDVNGYDFWNSSAAVDRTKHKYGDILHTGVKSMKSGKKKGELTVTADWINQDGGLMLKETTTYVFGAVGEQRTIDRITTLTATQEDITFKDSKEGVFAVRLARQLEHPSNKPELFTDASGIATKVPALNNTGVTGSYTNKEGIKGEDVWAKRSVWCNLTGQIGNEKIGVAIIDHPKNVSYPSYWHARGYGLFAINPMGTKEFTNGKEAKNFQLKKGESQTFRYRLVVDSKYLTEAELDALAADFAKVK